MEPVPFPDKKPNSISFRALPSHSFLFPRKSHCDTGQPVVGKKEAGVRSRAVTLCKQVYSSCCVNGIQVRGQQLNPKLSQA